MKNDLNENYTVKIASTVFDSLEQDIDVFNQGNRNRLINKIILTYLKIKDTEDISEKIYSDISNYIKDIEKNEKKIRSKIKNNLYENITIQKNKSVKTLNIRLTNETYESCISLGAQPGYFDTGFFRTVFDWYLSKPKYKRERILFNDEYNKLQDAIKRKIEIKLEIKLGISGTLKLNSCYPLELFSAKDENYNYLLSTGEDGKIYPTRLSNILKLNLIQKKFSVSSEIAEKAKEKAEKKYYTWGEAKKIVIKLTEKGYHKYKIVSHLRPKVVEKIKEEEGKSYVLTFNETEDTMMYYFPQFGKEFQVLEPESLKNKFRNFYLEALENHNY
ncbi:MAG: WYL domain-containing protein [Cetobacterium sp.]